MNLWMRSHGLFHYASNLRGIGLIKFMPMALSKKAVFRSGEADLEKIRQICIHYEKPVPTELRMIYDCKSGKIDTEYKYESICSAKTGTDSSEIFMKWLDEVRQSTWKR